MPPRRGATARSYQPNRGCHFETRDEAALGRKLVEAGTTTRRKRTASEHPTIGHVAVAVAVNLNERIEDDDAVRRVAYSMGGTPTSGGTRK
jgi:hypothetical protein